MSRDSNVLQYRQPDSIDDPLNKLAREGARRMLAEALIADADAFVAQLKDLKLPDECFCHRRDVRFVEDRRRLAQRAVGDTGGTIRPSTGVWIRPKGRLRLP